MRFSTYLQGSYANDTIVHGSSDVDILVRMDNPYNANKTRLPSRLRQRYQNEASFYTENYSLTDFQNDVFDELQDIYDPSAVEQMEKAVVIDASECQLSLSADVVPCQQHRIYKTFNGDQNDEDTFYQGIRFETTDGTEVVSFPQRHMDRGQKMNEDCDGNYKETVRIFKNARDYLISLNQLQKGDAQSYYVECLLYNVPAEKFHTSDLQERYADIAVFLRNTGFRSFEARHGLENLFGRGETQWSTRKAMQFVEQLHWLWDYEP